MGTLQCLNAILQRETTFITSRFPGRRNLYKWGYSFKCKNLLQGSKLFCIRIDSIEKGAGGVGRGGGGGEGVQSKENGRVASTKSAYSAKPTV